MTNKRVILATLVLPTVFMYVLPFIQTLEKQFAMVPSAHQVADASAALSTQFTASSGILSTWSNLCGQISNGSQSAGAALVQSACVSGKTGQGFTFTKLSDGNYTIAPQQVTGMCLQDQSGNITQQPCSGASSQEWSLKSDGSYTNIINAGSNQCMNVAYNSTVSGGAWVTYKCDSGFNERFAPTAPSVPTPTPSPAPVSVVTAPAAPAAISSGIQSIVSNWSNLCGEISNSSASAGAALLQNSCVANKSSQSFSFTRLGDGNYTIAPQHVTGMCLQDSGGNVTQQLCSGYKAQEWSLKSTGTYTNIVNSDSNRCMNVAYNSTLSGGVWVTYACDNSALNERFSSVSSSPTTAPQAPTQTTTPAPTPAATVTLSSSVASVSPGNAATLTWSSTNATSCSASGAWDGTKTTGGSQTVSGLTSNGIYTLSCTGTGGTGSKSIAIEVATPVVTTAPVVTPTLPVPNPSFSIGSRVQTTQKVKVRTAANGTSLGTQSTGTTGTIVDGPTTTGGLVWWKINYDTGVDGWSAEKSDGVALLVTSTTPAPTPITTPTPVTTTGTGTQNTTAVSGGTTSILQASIAPQTIPQGSSVRITYNWNAVPMDGSYSVFVHIVNSQGTTVFQDDHVPFPTTLTWSGNISYTRSVVIPANTPDGTYKVIAGLYGSPDRQPLKMGSGVTDAGNMSYQIGTFTVDHTASAAGAVSTYLKPSLDLSNYKMTFDDEFNAPLNISEWGSGTTWISHKPDGGDFGWTGGSPTNGTLTVANGVLDIKAFNNGSGYKGGIISSVDKYGNGFAQQYGYFEMRAKLPGGDGSEWPAFWLLSQKHIQDPTVPDVENDVIEQYGSSLTDYITYHHWTSQPVSFTTPVYVGDMFSTYHTYGVMIDPNWMTYYFDGIQIAKVPTPPEANTPMYILADLAVTDQSSKTPNPSDMLIDYIRAYQSKSPYATAPAVPQAPDPAKLVGMPITLTPMNSFLKVRVPSTGTGGLIQDTADNSTDEQFKLIAASSGTYYLQSVANDKCVTVANGSYDNGATTDTEPCSKLPSQQFIFTAQSDTSDELKSALTGRCPGVSGNSTAAGTSITQWDCNGTPNNHYLLRTTGI